nr:MAG TPA: hypothetical protein [Caudoviricetes sp.]
MRDAEVQRVECEVIWLDCLYLASIPEKSKFYPKLRGNQKYTNSVYFSFSCVKIKAWHCGGVVTQRSAKPCTPVQFRSVPPKSD